MNLNFGASKFGNCKLDGYLQLFTNELIRSPDHQKHSDDLELLGFKEWELGFKERELWIGC